MFGYFFLLRRLCQVRDPDSELVLARQGIQLLAFVPSLPWLLHDIVVDSGEEVRKDDLHLDGGDALARTRSWTYTLIQNIYQQKME